MRMKSCWLGLLCILFATASSSPRAETNRRIETGIADSLLARLAKGKILVIPECLSHDSYDAIQLPVALMRRWVEEDHGIKKLIVGLEKETGDKEFELVRNDKYYLFERSATICPSQWGLFSTRSLNLYLFLSEIMNRAPDRFQVFGFENSSEYYDPKTNKYLLPSQIDTVKKVEEVDYYDSKAPMAIKYAYSRFFRDYRSFSTVKGVLDKNPDARLLIIVGNAHTLKELSLNDTDRQIIGGYGIDTLKYAHYLGHFLRQYYPTIFVQSLIDTSHVARGRALVTFKDDAPAFPWLKNFYTDWYYAIPAGPDVNLEEPPLVCIPSARNLSLLENKRFQIYSSEEFFGVARRLVYFMTGVTPEVKEDAPGQTGACTFVDPRTGQPVALHEFDEPLLQSYFDGTFIERLRGDVAGYNHRSLFEGIFRMMGKKDFKTMTDAEGREFSNYLFAVLSVIGTGTERALARKRLSEVWGDSGDYYFYYKKYYFKQYRE